MNFLNYNTTNLDTQMNMQMAMEWVSTQTHTRTFIWYDTNNMKLVSIAVFFLIALPAMPPSAHLMRMLHESSLEEYRDAMNRSRRQKYAWRVQSV